LQREKNWKTVSKYRYTVSLFEQVGFFFNFLSGADLCPILNVWAMSFRIVETLILLGEKLGCYKISLECKDPLLSYYTQFGFKLEEGQNYLCKRFYH